MGFGITAVCTVAAYSSHLALYDSPALIPTYSAIVNGGNCSLTLDTFTGDAGDLIEVFNITTANQMQFEDISCNISSSLGCNTNYFVFSGLPYQQLQFEFVAVNGASSSNAVNWTYYILPPVPSQPPAATLVNAATQVVVTTSQYSSEYGSALIGCLVAAGPYPWTPAAGAFPTTLSSTPSQNSLPYTSYAMYQPAQNTSITVDLTSMNLQPATTYDFWVLCYNGNGQSPNSIGFNQTTSASLPIPAPQTSSSSTAASTSNPTSTTSTGSSAATVVSSSSTSTSVVSATSTQSTAAATSTAVFGVSSSSSVAPNVAANAAAVVYTPLFVSFAVAGLAWGVLAVLTSAGVMA